MSNTSIHKAAVAIVAAATTLMFVGSQARGDAASQQTQVQPAHQAAAAEIIQLAGGDSIAVIILSDIGSRVSKQGDTFAVVTADDYLVGGKLILPKGSPGYGTITHLKGAGAYHAPGELRFEVNKLTAPDGSTFATITNGDTADAPIHYERNGSDTMQWLLWGGFGAAHKKGDDMLIPAGSLIHLVVAGGRGAPVVAQGTAPAVLDLSQVTIPVKSPSPAPSTTITAPATAPAAVVSPTAAPTATPAK
jgi:hypothetical protein